MPLCCPQLCVFMVGGGEGAGTECVGLAVTASGPFWHDVRYRGHDPQTCECISHAWCHPHVHPSLHRYSEPQTQSRYSGCSLLLGNTLPGSVWGRMVPRVAGHGGNQAKLSALPSFPPPRPSLPFLLLIRAELWELQGLKC